MSAALIAASLALLFGPGLREHVRTLADPWRFNDDARQQITPFLRYMRADPAPADYSADYWLATLPRGYRLLYSRSAPLVDPRTMAKLVPLAELVIVVAALMAATWRLAGPAAAWGCGALCLSTHVYLARMSGGLPRSFGFPLTALAVLALVRGHAPALCILTILGAAFYYPSAVLLGLTSAIYLLVLPAAWRGAARPWSLRVRLAALGATAGAVALLTLPAMMASRTYGPLIERADLAAYPEAGQGGRYRGVNLPRRDIMAETALGYATRPPLSRGPAWIDSLHMAKRGARRGWPPMLLAGLLIAAYAALLTTSIGARRLLALVAAAFAMYAVALTLWPHFYLPARYLEYSLPLLPPVLVPAGAAWLVHRIPGLSTAPTASAALVVAAVAVLALLFGSRAPGDAGINRTVPADERPLYDFIAQLPADAIIAGWPHETVDTIPYLSERRILIGYETHQAFHKRYVDEMRRRMRALIDAYFAADVAPLLRLRCEFGVTHLLVDRRYYQGTPPTYFKPFDAMIADAVRHAPPRPVALEQPVTATVFDDGTLLLLDLSRLPAPATDPQ